MGLMDDDIIIPDFPDDEEPDVGVDAEQAQNRTFLIASAVLAAVFVLGLCAALVIILTKPGEPGEAALNIEQTNAARMAEATQTAIAAGFTVTPAPTQVAEATATVTPAASATPLLVATQTQVAEAQGELATLSETQIAQGTSTPFETVAPSAAQPTLAVTQLGGTGGTPSAPGLATPTRIVSGVGGVSGVVTATALPSTGIGIGTGIAGAGALALVLLAVVVVARRLRLS